MASPEVKKSLCLETTFLPDWSLCTQDRLSIPVCAPGSDPANWRRLIVDRPGGVVLQAADDSFREYEAEYQASRKVLRMTPLKRKVLDWKMPGEPVVLAAADWSGDQVVAQGTIGRRPLTVRFQRIDRSAYLLAGRGFHWITGRPLNW